MLEASQVEMPPSAVLDLRRFFAAGIASRPSMTSRLMSCPVVGMLRPNTHLADPRHRHNPIRDYFFVPLRPRPLARFLEQSPDQEVLIVIWGLGIDRDELEDDRQRFVFLDDAADELLVTLEWIFDVRHILPGFVILW